MQLSSRSGKVPFPELMPCALAVMESVQDMANIAQKIAFESVDEVPIPNPLHCMVEDVYACDQLFAILSLTYNIVNSIAR